LGFLPKPVPTFPDSLRSMCQLSLSPAEFFSVKAKTAPPCFRASFRSASLALSASLMASNASDDGNLSALGSASARLGGEGFFTVLERHSIESLDRSVRLRPTMGEREVGVCRRPGAEPRGTGSAWF